MSYLQSLWGKIDANSIYVNATDVYQNLVKELHSAWESEDWQIKVLMVEIVVVAALFILIALAWKIHGPSIAKLLNAESNNTLETKLAKSRNCATLSSYSKQHLKKIE